MPHVLIVDDNVSNINVLGMLLEQANVSYSSVIDPMQIGAALVQNAPFDAVFLDLEFPQDDGLEMLPQLREMDGLRHVPIVAYSVHTSEIDLARQAGFDGFLGKPIDAYDFPDHLLKILNGEQVWVV